MSSTFTFSCVMDAMRKFHAYGFKVLAIIIIVLKEIFIDVLSMYRLHVLYVIEHLQI